MAMPLDKQISRRGFMKHGALTAGALLAARPRPAFGGDDALFRRPRVAAVFTVFRYRSHAYNFLQNFLGRYLFNGRLTDPGCDVVSFYADQFPENDLARSVSRRFQIPLFESIEEALCLGGTSLAVDAVLLIGEHGEYPYNDIGQHMYPRKAFFDRIVNVMKRSGRFVPIFNDKHLSHRWDWAKAMYDTAAKLDIPFMAGSSVPLAQRCPPVKMPTGAEIDEAVSIHGGGLESYDFHGLEVLQSMVEFRKGGETGVSQVELLSGDDVMRAAREGRWSKELAERAMQAEFALRPQQKRTPLGEPPYTVPHALLLTYKDGLRATVLKVGSSSDRWNFACRMRNEAKSLATAFYNGPWGNRCLFRALSHAIQHFFVHHAAPYPVERTLLTTGVLDAAMHSHAAGGNAMATPHLQFAYSPIDFRAMREMGTSWKIITEATPQPKVFSPGDEKWVAGSEQPADD